MDLNVSASTQNQALNALVFLYKHVIQAEIGDLGPTERAKKPERLPTVMSREEVGRLHAGMTGIHQLMGKILYGCGLRLMECVRLRVKDVDFDQNQIVVRDGKGMKDRVTMLPEQLKPLLREQINRVRLLHEQDLQAGLGDVYLPFALERKYPNAARELGWQYVFPADRISVDPRSGKRRRHHMGEASSSGPCRRRAGWQISPSPSAPIRSATVSPPTSSKRATISGPSRNSWGTRTSRRP